MIGFLYSVGHDTCAVVGSDGCHSPAGTSYYVRLAECFRCADSVCTDFYCSRRVLYGKYGRKRLCATCIDEEQRAAKREASA